MLTESWKLFKVIKLIGVSKYDTTLIAYGTTYLRKTKAFCRAHIGSLYESTENLENSSQCTYQKTPIYFSINNKTNHRILGNGKRQRLFSKQGKEEITSKYVKYKILYFKVNRHVLILE